MGQGCKKIGVVDGCLDKTTGVDRLKGYLKALEEAGIARDESLIKNGNFKKKAAEN